MNRDHKFPAGIPINERTASFVHLPFTVDLLMAKITHCTGSAYDTLQGRWCDEECQGPWDWDFCDVNTKLVVRFFFEFENDALLFKLRWF
jgi:hypothetical protein